MRTRACDRNIKTSNDATPNQIIHQSLLSKGEDNSPKHLVPPDDMVNSQVLEKSREQRSSMSMPLVCLSSATSRSKRERRIGIWDQELYYCITSETSIRL